MKNKKTYILLIVVVIVWGFLLVKIYSAFFGEEEVVISQNTKREYNQKKDVLKETLQVEYPERDPFLGIIYKPKPEPKAVSVKQMRPTYDSIFNAIAYQGFLKNKKDSSHLYLISYRQRSYVLRPKEVFEDIEFLKGSKEEIQVRYKTITKTIDIAK
ncbi:hypothetical protein [Psychroflexus tropicus]|uniref:hypothetical protein n=1 Tax=Psychroflexus tropicus TaxID=197345 RepID=UPI00036517BA|nr:hypothetical protein [Psychroflexus tropicus]